MIRSEAEYRKAQRDIELSLAMVEGERDHWLNEGVAEGQAEVMLQPLHLRIAQLSDRIALFERVRAGDLSMFATFEDIGRALIAARLAKGLSQREFAELVGVHESQVSRDEKNEYHGVGRERLRDLLDTLGLHFAGHFQLEAVVAHPRLVAIEQPVIYLQAAGLALSPEEVEKELINAIA